MGVAAEAAAFGVGRSQGVEGRQQRLLVQPFLQDRIDGLVMRCAIVIGARARGFEPHRAVFLFQPQHTLDGVQLDQDLVAEQATDQSVTGRADLFGARQAPLGVLRCQAYAAEGRWPGCVLRPPGRVKRTCAATASCSRYSVTIVSVALSHKVCPTSRNGTE